MWFALDLLTANWEESFAHLEQYVDEQGDAMVPRGFKTDDGYGLGQWVTTQRSAYSGGELSEERIVRLEELQGWVGILAR